MYGARTAPQRTLKTLFDQMLFDISFATLQGSSEGLATVISAKEAKTPFHFPQAKQGMMCSNSELI